ncbi:iron ABC transporter substrate-binding protein [Solibacillus silvestris]
MKFLSWKGISIYLTIILFLLIFIQILDWNKGNDKEAQYAVELEKAYIDLVDFQTYILNDEVRIDDNKHVLTMYEKNFQYQLSMFIDIFGNKKVDDLNLFDSYKQIDEALASFYEAENAEQQGQAHEQLIDAKHSLFTVLNDLK